MEFAASGVGAVGERRNYEFELEFFDHVERGVACRVGPNIIQDRYSLHTEHHFKRMSLATKIEGNYLVDNNLS